MTRETTADGPVGDTPLASDKQRRAIRERYGALAAGGEESTCCDSETSTRAVSATATDERASCCTDGPVDDHVPTLGYSAASPASVAGAAPIPELETVLAEAGVTDVTVEPKAESERFIRDRDGERDLSDSIVAARIEATEPTTEGADA